MKYIKSKLENMEISVNKQLEEIIPKLSKDKFATLKSDISDNGLKKPVDVMVTGETDTAYTAIIVDGHHRYRAMKELGKSLSYPDNITVLDICTVEEALEYSFEINWFRRKPNDYPAAKWVKDVYGPKGMTYKEMAKKVSLTETMLDRSAFITKASNDATNKTDNEMSQIQQIIAELDLDDPEKVREVHDVYTQFKEAQKASDTIFLIEDEDFKKQMEAEWETKKYTDKQVVKHLEDMIRIHKTPTEITPYDKDVYPVMVKLCKLEDKYSSVNTVTTAGSESAIANAEETIRKYIMNNMDEAITDIQEGLRQILEEILVEKQTKDLAVIMTKVKEILPICKNDYFVAAMQVPNNPKGVVE